MPKLNKSQRYRARKQLELSGKPIPPELNKMNVGRKRSSQSNVTKCAKQRKKYHEKKLQRLGLKSTTISTSMMTLRPRKKHAKNLLLGKACDMINTWATQLMESTDSVRKLRKAMGEVKNAVGKSFKWIQMEENQFSLFFVSSISGETVFHPWVDVKKSEIIEENQEEKCFGLYAARDFPDETEIGIYTGNVETIRKGTKSSEFKLYYREKYLIDIVDQSENRLKYQMGAHMVNDEDWKEKGTKDKTNNNAMISDHLILYSMREIKNGEEITVPYNLDK